MNGMSLGQSASDRKHAPRDAVKLGPRSGGAVPPTRSVRMAWHALRGLALGCLMVLAGCDQLGIESPQKATERQMADAKAVGGACRHAMRAIEDCYVLNAKADKASVFQGWRDMDEYMRENKLEGVVPVVPRPPTPAQLKASAAAAAAASAAAEEDGGDAVTAKDGKGAKADAKAETKGHSAH